MGGGDSDGGDPQATTGGQVLPRGRAAPAAVADSGVWAAWALPASPRMAQLPLHLPREAARATPAQAGLGDGHRWARAFR